MGRYEGKSCKLRNMNKIKIGIIGLGYVGLPLAVEFAKKYNTYGFDINVNRINELKKAIDSTLEVSVKELSRVLKNKKNTSLDNGLSLWSEISQISECNFFIVTVPTPVDKNKNPILNPLIESSSQISRILKKGDYVVYESTVYPGLTEEVCIPILENGSALKLNKDFYVGYSPERINPGDKNHTVSKIKKVTSGSSLDSAIFIDKIYNSVIKAGTFLASSIRVAEAAKVIENSQRDINIAFMNELAKIFNKMNIDTHSVLEAASTKWNFLNFKPGLVGGHCIGVDPYYLAQKAKEIGYNPEIILTGRRINDQMGSYVANQLIKLMINNNNEVLNSNILMLGLTFKENCPDIRNSKAIDIYDELKRFKTNVDVYDPWAEKNEVKKVFNIDLIGSIKPKYNAIILAVAHDEFKENLDIRAYLKTNGVVYDVKGFLDLSIVDGRL